MPGEECPIVHYNTIHCIWESIMPCLKFESVRQGPVATRVDVSNLACSEVDLCKAVQSDSR